MVALTRFSVLMSSIMRRVPSCLPSPLAKRQHCEVDRDRLVVKRDLDVHRDVGDLLSCDLPDALDDPGVLAGEELGGAVPQDGRRRAAS